MDDVGLGVTPEHSLLVAGAGYAIGSLGPLTNGQILIGSTGAAAVPATLTDGNNITFTEGAGSITANVTGTTQYAVQVGDATGSLDSIGVGATGTLLVGAGAAANPAFGTSANGDFTFTSSTAGATRSLTVTNTEAANAASHAKLDIVTGGANGGDPYLHLNTGVTEYSWGIDNSSTGDLVKLTTGASPSAGTTLMTIGNNGVKDFVAFLDHTGPANITQASLQINDSSVGGNVGYGAFNTDNTNAASDCLCTMVVGGANGGDPAFTSLITGGQSFTWGIDNSDADKLKMTNAVTPSAGNTLWQMTTAGERTLPLQPAFLATHSVAQDNVTGNGTEATVNFTTEVFDQNADYDATNAFTAPVTGKHAFNMSVYLTGLIAGSEFRIGIITSNRNYKTNYFDPVSVGQGTTICSTMSVFADMDAADTAHAIVYVLGEGADICDLNSANQNTYFSGALIC